MRFDKKVVIVTGGGSGMGRATSLAFAAEGADVTVADVNDVGGNDTVKMIQAKGGSARFIHTDVSKRPSVDALVDSVVSSQKRLDVYFSNAGVADAFEPCIETSDEQWLRVMGINLSGCFYGARAALPHLIKTGGNIIMTTSVAAVRAKAGGSAYTASKHGVHGLISQLAYEYASQGVRINGVAPGAIKTNVLSREIMEDPKTDAFIRENTPMGRWGKPEEIAAAVLFLASSDASFITGAMLPVDGGWVVK